MEGPKLWSAPEFARLFVAVYAFRYWPVFATAVEVLGHDFAVYTSLLSYLLSQNLILQASLRL